MDLFFEYMTETIGQGEVEHVGAEMAGHIRLLDEIAFFRPIGLLPLVGDLQQQVAGKFAAQAAGEPVITTAWSLASE